MKTLKNKTQQVKREITCLFLLSIGIWFAGCEKAEQLNPASGSATKNESAKILPLPSAAAMLIIEHNSARTRMPDYKIILLENGMFSFEGRRNVSHIGLYRLETDLETVAYIKNMFEAAHFFNIQQVPIQLDAPSVSTSFSNGIRSKTLIDFNDGNPQILIQIRKRAEEKLNLSKYINGLVPVPPAPVSL